MVNFVGFASTASLKEILSPVKYSADTIVLYFYLKSAPKLFL